MNRLLKLAFASVLAISAVLAQTSGPQGRLTLAITLSPILPGDITGATAVYYVPYVGGNIPISNSTTGNFVSQPIFPQNYLSLTTSAQLAGKIYDVFAFMNSGVVTLGTGPAWSNSTTRSAPGVSSSGTFPAVYCNNSASITLTTATATYTIPQTEATYLGSIYMTANGQTGVQMKPTPAAGGSNNIIGLWNAYNRVPIYSLESETAMAWTYSGTTWEPFNNNFNNRVTYLDGLGLSSVKARVTTIASNATISNGAWIGISQDSTMSAPIVRAGSESVTNSPAGTTSFVAEESFTPAQGLHFLQAMQLSPNGTTATFAFNPAQTFLLYTGEY